MDFVVRAKNINDLKIMMIKKGFTKAKLAKEAKLSKDTIITVFDEKHVGPTSINKFCTALGIDEDNFDKYFIIEDANKSTRNALAKANDGR